MMATLPLIILLVLFVIGFPIGFALMLCVVPYFALAAGIPMDVIIQRFIASTESTSLLAIPFFVLSGNIMAKAGISRRLIDFVDTCVGHKKGGIAIVCVIVSCFFGNIKQEIQVHHIIDDNREIPSSEVPGADSCCLLYTSPSPRD